MFLRNIEVPQHCSCPSAMIAIRSPRRSASSMKWVDRIIVRPARWLCRMSHVCLLASGSIPDVGSSRTINWRHIQLAYHAKSCWSEIYWFFQNGVNDWITGWYKNAQLTLTSPRDAKPCRKLLQFDEKTSCRLLNDFVDVMEIWCLVIKFLIQITSTYTRRAKKSTP